jgi:hypothetical protein
VIAVSEDCLFKVRFRLNPEDEQGFETEAMWAESVASFQFRLRSCPFFAFGVSLNDVVQARETQNGFEFERVIERGGHSTYRVYLKGGFTLRDVEFRERWEEIKRFGAFLESANDRLAAIDIPPGKDSAAIYRLLEAGEEQGIWALEEGHYEPEHN